MAIASVAEISSMAPQGFVEPVMDSMAEEVRVAVGTKRESVRLEEQPHQVTLVGVRYPRPHGSQTRAMGLRLGSSGNSSTTFAVCFPHQPEEADFTGTDAADLLCSRFERPVVETCRCPIRQLAVAFTIGSARCNPIREPKNAASPYE